MELAITGQNVLLVTMYKSVYSVDMSQDSPVPFVPILSRPDARFVYPVGVGITDNNTVIMAERVNGGVWSLRGRGGRGAVRRGWSSQNQIPVECTCLLLFQLSRIRLNARVIET